MANYTTNTLRTEDKGCNQVLIWIIDPFCSVLQLLKEAECHLVKSPVIHTWWDDKWQIKLIFFLETNYPAKYAVKTVIVNSKVTKVETFPWKGDYHFNISFFVNNEEEVIHNSAHLSSEHCSSTPWLTVEPLKIRIEIKCSLLKNILRFKPMAFNFHDRLSAIKETEQLLDFTISVCGQEIKTNKTILSLASPVFLAMFSHDFKETQRQTIYIEDVNVDTVKKILDFLHSGQISDFTDLKSAIELLYLFEKYEVQDLKKICLTYIHSTFSGIA